MASELAVEALLGELVRIEAQLGPITAAEYERLDEDLARRIEVVDGYAVYRAAPSRRTDTVTKLAEYAKAGIPHYWLVRLDQDASGTIWRVGTIEVTIDWRELADLTGG